MIAHELRAPLTSLATASELLLEDFETLEPRQIRAMLSVIREGTLWLQGLVENVLYAATMEAGCFHIQPEPVSLLDVVLDVQPVVEPLLLQKDQCLQFASRKGLPEVSADRRAIGQVLVNLVANASKYSEAGKPIAIQLAASNAYVRVTVADRGPGLAPDTRARLFEPFYRGADAPSHAAGGVGLGLAIVKSIVEAHGGHVGADNRTSGGASIWFDLAALPGTAPF